MKSIDLQSGGVAEGTSEQERAREDKYLRLNLASVLWFGRQITFIFLQHTHTRQANNENLVTSAPGLSHVNH